LVQKYQDIFSDAPKITHLLEHKTELTLTEIVRSKAYYLPYHLKVDKEIDDLLANEFIEPSQSAYSSPIVVVKKKGIEEIRLCVNYNKLNENTIFDPQSMPSIEDIITKLSGSNLYSSTDCCKGYYAIKLDESSKDYTTFICHRGLFRFKVAPFWFGEFWCVL
jgi:hypothetical protein